MRSEWNGNLGFLYSALRKQHGSSDSSGAATGAKQTQQSAPINLAAPRLQTYTRVSAAGINKKENMSLAFQAWSRQAGSILELCCKHRAEAGRSRFYLDGSDASSGVNLTRGLVSRHTDPSPGPPVTCPLYYVLDYLQSNHGGL